MKLYQKLFTEMLETHKELFVGFRKIHDLYQNDSAKYQVEFNQIGEKVNEVIRIYERKLVGTTERSGYSKFSTNLSDKFWSEVRKVFSKIDFVGVKQ